MKKSFILVTVVGVLLILIGLALAAIYTWTQLAQSSEHKIRRMRLYYAAQAAMVAAMEDIRQDGALDTATLAIGAGLPEYPAAGIQAQITVDPLQGPLNSDRITVDVSYP